MHPRDWISGDSTNSIKVELSKYTNGSHPPTPLVLKVEEKTTKTDHDLIAGKLHV